MRDGHVRQHWTGSEDGVRDVVGEGKEHGGREMDREGYDRWVEGKKE